MKVCLLLGLGAVLMMKPWVEWGLRMELQLEIGESWGSALGWG